MSDNDGNKIFNSNKQIEPWKEYFEEVLSGTLVAEPSDLLPGEKLDITRKGNIKAIQ